MTRTEQLLMALETARQNLIESIWPVSHLEHGLPGKGKTLKVVKGRKVPVGVALSCSPVDKDQRIELLSIKASISRAVEAIDKALEGK